MTQITLKEFLAAAAAQNVATGHIAFRCPVCGTIQSTESLRRAGAGPEPEAIDRVLGFSCVGRWTNAGPHVKGTPPGSGCDWTLGGLFRIHKLEVVMEDGYKRPCFELAAPEEAQALMREQLNQPSAAAGSGEVGA